MMHILSVQATVKWKSPQKSQPYKTEVIDSDQPVITLTFRPYLTNIWGKVMTKLLQI